MRYRVGVEDIEPGNWVAWVFEFPGCFGSGETQEEAIASLPTRISDYFGWRAQCGMSNSEPRSPEFEVAEVFHSYRTRRDYVANAFFEDDRRPLATEEIEEALRCLRCARGDLLKVVDNIPPDELRRRRFEAPNRSTSPLAEGSIEAILNHIAWAEWWYFERLGLSFSREEMPESVFAKLERTRANTVRRLPGLAGDVRVVERRGELWSARKIVRRTLWHERDHTQQSARLAGGIKRSTQGGEAAGSQFRRPDLRVD